MKSSSSSGEDKPMQDEYDFSGGERGRYSDRYAEGTNIVRLDPDVAELFPDSESVNAALRALANIAKKQASSVKTRSRPKKAG